jgi:uncharacterized protein (DUF1330 family)
MKAHLIAIIKVNDVESYKKEYIEKAGPLLEKYEGKVILVSEQIKYLEGELPEGEIIIVEFPSMEHAETFYNSADYQPFIEVRNRYTISNILITNNQVGLEKMSKLEF